MDDLGKVVALIGRVANDYREAIDDYHEAFSSAHPVAAYIEWRRVRSKAQDALVEQLRAAGFVIRRAGPVCAVKGLGIQSISTGGLLSAINNWLAAVRRKLDAEG